MAKLRVIVIGAGIGGLCAAYCVGRLGHEVVVLERNTEISDIGAGIQISPNMSRLLIRWGLGEKLSQVGVKPEFLTFHRYDNGKRLGFSWFGERMESAHGAPYYHIHRADLIQMLQDLASPYMKLKLGCRVLSIDPFSSSVELEGGSRLYGDLIIGADGFRSLARDIVAPGHPLKTVGDVAYRMLIPAELLRRDEALAELVTTPNVRCWMGPERHIVSYLVRGGLEYNVVLIAPDHDHHDSKKSWVAEGSMTELRAMYSGWDLRVQKLLRLATSCLKTKITYSDPLPKWSDSLMRIALVGDACHPMLPYGAQAGAMAVEDAAVLGTLFSKIGSVEEIPTLLRAYQEIRAPRTAATLQSSLLNRSTFHLADGAEQERRDQSMRVSMETALREDTHSRHAGNANQWADTQKSRVQFDYDAEGAATWFREVATQPKL